MNGYVRPLINGLAASAVGNLAGLITDSLPITLIVCVIFAVIFTKVDR